jgi:hypothetical protein
MHVKNQDSDFAGHQQIADLVAGGNVPQPPGAAHGFAKRLQKRFVAGENHEFDDVARETEPQRIQGASFFVGS